MKKLTVRLFAAALLAIPFGTARADLVLSALELNSGQGFGAVFTIFTLQVTGNPTLHPDGLEDGCYAFGDLTGAFNGAESNTAGTTVNSGNFCTEGAINEVASGSPKNALPSLGELGITQTNQIGLLVNLNQVSNQGITINDMVLSFYTASGDVIFNATLPNSWCTVAALCSGVDTFLSSINGQGGNGQLFVLDAAQQAALAAAIAASGQSFGSILVGSAASLGCVTNPQTANCKAANDGAESFQLANISSPIVTVPEPTTTALVATGLLGLFGVARRRRQGHSE
jgi:hypothetical protein